MRKRNLSEFMCIEMLYDYKTGRLDALRRQAVEEGMEGSPRVREELRKLNAGINFCNQLRETKVEDALVQYILKQPKQSEKIVSQLRWGGVPQPLRWAIEAVVVAVAISLFVIQTPKIFRHITKIDNSSLIVKKFDIPTVTVQTTTAPETIIAPTEAPVKEEKKAPEVVLAPIVSPVVPVKKEIVAIPVVAAPASAPAPTPVATPVKKGNAYLYRMVMQSEDVDTISPKIVDLIKSLGGEKAGDVELGWRRKGGSYFHFSLPLVNNQAFQDGLKKIGIFSIVKTPHSRVMPIDTERFILWVEEKKSTAAEQKAQGAAQTDEEDDSGSDNKDTDAQ